MIRNGNVELQAKEEEIRFSKMQLNEENRTIELLRKNLPNKLALEQELVTLQIQVSITFNHRENDNVIIYIYIYHKSAAFSVIIYLSYR